MSEMRRRTARILIRALPEEQQEIRDRARAAGLSAPEFLRRAALSRRIDPQARLTAEALRELSRIGNNLNQIAYEAHIGRYNQEKALTALAEVRRIAASLVGKGGPDR